MTSPDSPLAWTDDGQPRSRRFGDVYFSAEDGLAESRAVFLDGCGLPQAWIGRRRFVVGELGFGTGLNVAALLDLWRRTASPDAHLHIASVEAFPITAQDAARALARWPDLAAIGDLLTARWPGVARGRHRVDLPELRATLDVAILDVVPALAGWRGQADAWFLDGFSPALNPDMWTDEVLALVAGRTAPGGRAATFTVAGQVRRGLTGVGFSVEKQPGYGRKRERLVARFGGAPSESPVRRVAVIGAGIAGAAAARAVRAAGAEALVVEAAGAGAGGSGNPVALVTPRLDAGLGEAAGLFAQAFARAVQLYAAVPGAVLAEGVLQLSTGARDDDRFARIAQAGLFEPETLALLNADETSARLGEAAPGGLDQRTALAADPAPILDAWLRETIQARAAALQPTPTGWLVLDAAGGVIVEADAVIVANALAAGDLVGSVSLQAVRGQASWTLDGTRSPAAAWGGYAMPTRAGVLFGATHDRDDTATDVRAVDHARNRQTLADALPDLAARLSGARVEGRASIRAVTPDRLPLAGPAGPAGLFLLTGFGSRGFSLAPLLAEHVAAEALGAPSPISADAAALIHPGRFAERAARKARF